MVDIDGGYPQPSRVYLLDPRIQAGSRNSRAVLVDDLTNKAL